MSEVDWSGVTEHASKMSGFTESDKEFKYDSSSLYGQPSPKKAMTVGFGHETVIGAAGTVLKGIEAGAISRFYLIGGCDGDAESRNYYTDLAENLPETSVVLTLGCGKFRISDEAKSRLGNIGDTGIPRVLDVGQCNDTYSAIRIALALSDALKCKVTDLPLSIVLSWYEQKAIAVLLTCLHLGLKPIRIGPTLPAFVTGDVLNVLVKDFGIIPVGDVSEDIKTMHDAKAMS
jgi:hydroxylamine reductase